MPDDKKSRKEDSRSEPETDGESESRFTSETSAGWYDVEYEDLKFYASDEKPEEDWCT